LAEIRRNRTLLALPGIDIIRQFGFASQSLCQPATAPGDFGVWEGDDPGHVSCACRWTDAIHNLWIRGRQLQARCPVVAAIVDIDLEIRRLATPHAQAARRPIAMAQ
jgi:hypothetical protein